MARRSRDGNEYCLSNDKRGKQVAVDLTNDANLRAACEVVLAQHRGLPWYQNWLASLSEFLQKVQNATHDEFCSTQIQTELWESETLCRNGMGPINASDAIHTPSVAKCLWDIRTSLEGIDPQKYDEVLNAGWQALSRLVDTPINQRNTRLKKNRLFAALFPSRLTTIAHISKLRTLTMWLGLSGAEGDLSLHHLVRDHLDHVLGDKVDGLSTQALERMTLPWLLYLNYLQDQEAEATEIVDFNTGHERLNPLPDESRNFGMREIKEGLADVTAIIKFAKGGCKRAALIHHMQTVKTENREMSLQNHLDKLFTWGVIQVRGGVIDLTPRGEGLVETGEPDEISDWLLTRVVGFDHLLVALQRQPMSKPESHLFLQGKNSKWPSERVPNVTFWLEQMQLAEKKKHDKLHLTERGKTWAAQIHWLPQSPPSQVNPPIAPLTVPDQKPAPFQRPSPQTIHDSLPKSTAFSLNQVARLDAGLWSHSRRHFAVLTGLSGSGKTLLARGYAHALHQGQPDPAQYLLTIPVQPGWHDPSCVLGYINPLDSDSYVRTAFVDFLLDASDNPERPYTVVLDEMNLSHPEQYLAPLLSAMETGDRIEFHAQDDDISGVPRSIAYPDNLLIIGTVNMDETTHGLSDKVLDRASVIEFWDIDVDAFPGWQTSSLTVQQVSHVRDTLTGLVKALRPARLHFGWRTIQDVIGYIEQAETGGVIKFDAALDQAIYAKVLPKLRGEDSQRLQDAFDNCITLLEGRQLPESTAKLVELKGDLHILGTARFWR